MNIFDQAMEIEREGEALYRRFASEASEQGMKRIFTWLADQERKHYGIFEAMKSGKSAQVAEDAPMKDIKSIFEGWKDGANNAGARATQADIYKKALGLEEKSISFYEEHIPAVASQQKDALLAIIQEEKRHSWVLENIIEFIAKPEVWAENAEFSHLNEDYYL